MALLINCTETLNLVYDRGDDGYGVPVPGIRFKGTQELYDALDGIRKDLKIIGWLPYIESVLTAGLYVKKPGDHGDGNAWDFDGVELVPNPIEIDENQLDKYFFTRVYQEENETFWPLDPRIKTRLACLFSLRFPTVLTAGYNAAHEDHMHLSIAGEVGWRGSRSQVVCLQETLNAWFDAGLVVDGDLGKKTIHAWLHNHNYDSPIGEWWLDWLKRIAFDPPKEKP